MEDFVVIIGKVFNSDNFLHCFFVKKSECHLFTDTNIKNNHFFKKEMSHSFSKGQIFNPIPAGGAI